MSSWHGTSYLAKHGQLYLYLYLCMRHNWNQIMCCYTSTLHFSVYIQ